MDDALNRYLIENIHVSEPNGSWNCGGDTHLMDISSLSKHNRGYELRDLLICFLYCLDDRLTDSIFLTKEL